MPKRCPFRLVDNLGQRQVCTRKQPVVSVVPGGDGGSLVALPKILVVDDSPAVRETVRTALSSAYDVTAISVEELGPPIPDAAQRIDLVVAGSSAIAAHVAQLMTHATPVVQVSFSDDATSGRTEAITATRRPPRLLSPATLRRRVRAALDARSASAASRSPEPSLAYPYVPNEAAVILQRALRARLPLLLHGEPGTGKRLVARAIHQLTEPGRFLSVNARDLGDHSLSTPPHTTGGTLLLSDVDHLSRAGHEQLASLLGPGGLLILDDGALFRLITTAETDLEDALAEHEFPAALYYRLSVLAVHLPPLRERVQDIPPLAEHLAAAQARALGLPPVSFTPRAFERLSQYLWPGNLAEFEAVLARTLAIHRARVIDAEDLLFDPSAVRTTPPAPAELRPLSTLARGLGGQTLDLIINELAHEFKNPLVTVKTFAHHLQRILRDDPDQQQLLRLTGEAVQRMDEVVENLVSFTHLDAPVRRHALLSELLAEPLQNFAVALAARGARLEQPAAPVRAVTADPAQISYALSNLFRVLAQTVRAHDTVTLGYREPGTVVITLPPGSPPLGGTLVTMIEAPSDQPAPLPLGAAIAKTVFELNGGTLTVETTAGAPTIAVGLPPARREEEQLAGNGQAPRPDRR